MQDEQFIRQWTSSHGRFSTDFDRGLGHLANHFAKRQAATAGPIGSSYGFLAKYEVPKAPRPALSPTALASLRGLAATVITVVLWATVMLVATPTPGLAATATAAHVMGPVTLA